MNEKTIFKNTMALYLRHLVIVVINLYALRLVLNTLGLEDYGIYVAVTGFVALGSFLPGAMAAATQRYFAYALGQRDQQKLMSVFSVNVLVYTVIGMLALLALETFGLWFINEHLIIPAERFEAARRLYHAAIWTFVLGVFASPFVAILIAHEDMHIYAFLSIFDVALKLIAAIAITITTGDKLQVYGSSLLVVSLLTTMLYCIVCTRRYTECQFKKIYWDAELLKQVVDFTAWSFFGHFTSTVRTQAVTILLNQMTNPATVAARAIAVTVGNQVMIFAANFNTGLYPSIVKLYAANNQKKMVDTIINGSKLTFLLAWIFGLPMLLEMGNILKLWLGKPPEEATLFCQLVLIEVLITALSLPLTTAARAPGKMRAYELTLGTMQLGIFLASWFILSLGSAAYSVFVVAILVNLLMLVARLQIVGRLIGFKASRFTRDTLLPICTVIALSTMTSLIWKKAIPQGLLYGIASLPFYMFTVLLSFYFVGLDARGRATIRHFAAAYIARIGGARSLW